MERAIVLTLLLCLAGAFAWWVTAMIVIPARELLGVLKRIAEGDYRPVILTGMPLLFRNTAHSLRLVAEALDRKSRLIEEEEFSISAILESMTEGVVITEEDLRIRLVNKAAAAMFNLRGEVSGLLLPEVFMGHQLQAVAERASATGEVQRGEFALGITGRSERCHLVVTATSLKSPEMKTPAGFLLVLHDVTRLRELESVRREFVANVSHEFRTPMSIINGYLETLQEGGVGREMMRKSITVMRRHADRLNRLIEDLLTISRMEEKGVRLETAPMNLETLLRSVVNQLEMEVKNSGATVTLEVNPDLPFARLDGYRIEQAFSNLLVNALRHGTPQEGECGAVFITASLQGPEIAVSFQDRGPGIPLKDQEHIFERFYRVGGDRARQTGGTGLGLSIVKNVVQAHGGRVTLKSVPGEGSNFTIYLPV
jgi:two-component system, OmpR family, phosphate regulon sensor histidine kinase PhoR